MFRRKCCMNEPMMNPCDPCDRQQQPIMEPTITNCVEREFYHEVPQE